MEAKHKLGRGGIWQEKTIRKEQIRIRTQLNDFPKSKKRLNFILSELDRLSRLEDARSQVQRYIFAVSALVHHERHGGLSQKDIQSIYDLARGILLVQGIHESNSKLGFLFGDIHQVLSQIYRRSGRHWDSAWELQFASWSSQRTPPEWKGTQDLGAGIRAFRMGEAALAIKNFEKAEKKGVPPDSRSRLLLEKHRAFRLGLQFEKAIQLYEQEAKSPTLSETEKIEWEWEALCLSTQQNQRLGPLVRACRPRSRFHDYWYAIEAFLWSRCVKEREWIREFPTLKKLSRGLKENPKKKTGLWYLCAETIEDCYDSAIPYATRLAKLGRTLSRSSELLTVDQELLLWAAATRWLMRRTAKGFADLAHTSYQSLSYRLTNGENSDVLGVFEKES